MNFADRTDKHAWENAVQRARCPQCGGRVTGYTDDLGRGWVMCFTCGAQLPTESGYRGVKEAVSPR